MKTFAFLTGILVSACAGAAMVGTGRAVSVPHDAAQTCTAHCSSIGLGLNSVVIMANTVGCVCSPASSTPQAAGGASGMAALMIEQQQQNASRTSQTTTQTTHH